MSLLKKIASLFVSLVFLSNISLCAEDATFAFNFYSSWLNSNGGKTNLVFSPYSLRLGLEIPYLGSGGKTEEQMRNLLGYPLEPVKDKSLDILNGFWVQNDFEINPEYLKAIKEGLNADAKRLDFKKQPVKALAEINRFIKLQTKGIINNLFTQDQIQTDTRIVIANIIHFLGEWVQPFNPSQTIQKPFLSRGYPTKSVSMMVQEGSFPFYKNDDFAVLELPYKGNFSMYVLLPHREDGIEHVDQYLTDQAPLGWLKELKTSVVHVEMPQIKTTSRNATKAILQAMGLTIPFTTKAEFNGIAPDEGLFIGDIVHEAYVKIDEKGTEAVAATGISMSTTSIAAPRNTETFKVDHPFVFLICHRLTKEVFFIGRIIEL